MKDSRKVDVRKLQAAVVFVVGTFLAAFYLFGLRPLYDEIRIKKGEIEAKTLQLRQVQAAINRWEEVYGDYQLLQAVFTDFKRRIPTTSEVPLVMQQLDLAAQAEGMTVSRVSPGAAAYGERFAYVPIDLILNGSYDRIIAYLKRLQQLPFPLDIQALSLAHGQARTAVGDYVQQGDVVVKLSVSVLLDAPEGSVRYGSQK